MRVIATVQPPKLTVLAGIETKTLRRWPISTWIEARQEIWTLDGADPTPIICAYTKSGEYVGDLSFAKYLAGRCIHPERNKPEHSVCSIGYSRPDKAWYGWSHRAMVGFHLGDRIFDEAYGNDDTLFTQHGSVVIETLEQARESACRFAEYIS